MKRIRKILIVLSILLICASSAACGSGFSSGSVSPESTSDPVPVSSELVKNARISYLGPEGTYTEEAARFFFSDGVFGPRETVPDAIQDVKKGRADYAVIPQENTLGGAVTKYVDALIAEEDIYVVGEVILPIGQTLMGLPGTSIDEIRTVCSHEQGITQSAEWRKKNMPDAATQEMASTAAAASYVSESNDKSIAAIAAPGAAKLYGLSVLAENVQITDANKTRFYVLSSSRLKEPKKPQTNAVFVASCEANRLDDIIIGLHKAGAELVTVHDRPEGSYLGSYNYVIEVNRKSGLPDDVIEKLTRIPGLHYLGSFNVMRK